MHDSMEKTSVQNCPEAGCYSRKITYSDTTMRQLRALIELSSTCGQQVRVRGQEFQQVIEWLFDSVFMSFIQYDCVTAPLKFYDSNYAWWNDRDGVAQHYWTGNSINGTHTCSCGVTGTCIDSKLKCNCDASVGAALFDEGIASKIQLP